mgnify:CR=1 FL=1
MTTILEIKDLDFILESLKYTKLAFENYQNYPSHEYQQKRIREVNEVMNKLVKLKKELKG